MNVVLCGFLLLPCCRLRPRRVARLLMTASMMMTKASTSRRHAEHVPRVCCGRLPMDVTGTSSGDVRAHGVDLGV